MNVGHQGKWDIGREATGLLITATYALHRMPHIQTRNGNVGELSQQHTLCQCGKNCWDSQGPQAGRDGERGVSSTQLKQPQCISSTTPQKGEGAPRLSHMPSPSQPGPSLAQRRGRPSVSSATVTLGLAHGGRIAAFSCRLTGGFVLTSPHHWTTTKAHNNPE